MRQRKKNTNKNNAFYDLLSERYKNVEIVNATEVRWWMAQGSHTDETIVSEIRAMHDAGFRGVELCQLADKDIDQSVYGYGSDQWTHDVKLIINTAIDLGMTVSINSGAGWKVANVPGLDVDSPAANHCIVLLTEDIAAGETRKGAIPTSEALRPKAELLGVYAVRKEDVAGVYEPEGYIDVAPFVENGALEWTAPDCSSFTLMYYYMQSTADRVSPSVEPSYMISLFDRRGFEALRDYLSSYLLNDATLNEKIKKGDVQFFMDSLEYEKGKGIELWSGDFREIFKKRKGYDVLPFAFLTKGAPTTSIWNWSDNADLIGSYTLTNIELNKRILNDIYDVQTNLYIENFLVPLGEWLHTYGIKQRVQISYGKCLEISEPIAYVDYPEAENRNQKNQPDLYRLWSGGAHLQNKVLSSETGGLNNSAYSYTYQRHLQEAYTLYSTGYSRIVWHIWSSVYGPTASWPGYEGGDGMHQFYKFGMREPAFSEYGEFNAHLGRVQKLLREGKAGVDVGMIYMRYGQHLVYQNAKDWLHTHEPMLFPSTVLQDNGYTYDYISPELLKADGVYFDGDAKTIELAGYKALVLWQNTLSAAGAETVLEYACKGLPIIIIDGAASKNIYNDGKSELLLDTVNRLKALDNVVTVSSADDVLNALKELGIDPYVSFDRANQQLLTQTRRDGDNRYLFVYNYCNGALHNENNTDHGSTISTQLSADGSYKLYMIDAWTGKVKQVGCRHQNGKTVFDITLDYGDVALYALEASDECGCGVSEYTETERHEITDWTLKVESWTPSDEILTRTEMLYGVTTSEYAIRTEKTDITVKLDCLKAWDEIEGVGKSVSGKGYYSASFHYDGAADGAYIDFGTVTQSMKVFVNGKKTDPVNMNITKVDISALLKVGENVVEIEYSSNLNNIQLSRGVTHEGDSQSNFVGYNTGYQQYGVRQATLVKYTKSRFLR